MISDITFALMLAVLGLLVLIFLISLLLWIFIKSEECKTFAFSIWPTAILLEKYDQKKVHDPVSSQLPIGQIIEDVHQLEGMYPGVDRLFSVDSSSSDKSKIEVRLALLPKFKRLLSKLDEFVQFDEKDGFLTDSTGNVRKVYMLSTKRSYNADLRKQVWLSYLQKYI